MNNREILFRGKRIDNGEWIEGLPSYGAGYNITAIEVPQRLEYEGYFVDVDQKTVCEYTGLTDKNGRKIFEGDIVKVSDSDRDDEVFDTGDISFKNGAWYLCGEPLYGLDNVISFEFEIIGNIFDNSEILDSGGGPE